MFDAKLGYEHWADAASTATYIKNRSPFSHRSQTPWELFLGRKPDVSSMRVFVSKAYVHVPKQLRRKLDSLSTTGTFIGYEPNSKAYRVLMDTGKVQTSRDVTFNEQPSAANRAAAAEAEKANHQVSTGVSESPITVQKDNSKADSTGIDVGPTYSTDSEAEEEATQAATEELSQQLRIQLPHQLKDLSSHAFVKGRGSSPNRYTKPRQQWQVSLSLRPMQKQCGLQMHLSGSLQWMKKWHLCKRTAHGPWSSSPSGSDQFQPSG